MAERQKEKTLEIAKRINVLQNRKILEDELHNGTINPFVRPMLEGPKVSLEDLTIESRIISEEDEQEPESDLTHNVDTRKPVGNNAISNPEASKFYEFFIEKNPLPEGYFYFNESEPAPSSDSDVVPGSENNASKHLVLRSLHAESLQESSDKSFDESTRRASIRVVGDYEIKEHFDVSMIRKTPENLALLDDLNFSTAFDVDIDKLRDLEAERLELLISDTADSAKARPINKHVAFFKKPHLAQKEVDDYVATRTLELEADENEDKMGENYFWRFLTWLGYPSTWRAERYTKWQQFLKERNERLVKNKKAAQEKLNLTPGGELPEPEALPEDYYRRDSFDKPAYFERRNAKHPGRYDNT